MHTAENRSGGSKWLEPFTPGPPACFKGGGSPPLGTAFGELRAVAGRDQGAPRNEVQPRLSGARLNVHVVVPPHPPPPRRAGTSCLIRRLRWKRG